jgi:hypothetical protein
VEQLGYLEPLVHRTEAMAAITIWVAEAALARPPGVPLTALLALPAVAAAVRGLRTGAT